MAKIFADNFFAVIPTKEKLVPHALEVLKELSSRYNLYILSNGFKELQYKKMHSSGIDIYFKKVILSDDIGVLKPWPKIFHFALSATQSKVEDSLMIGDSWNNDIVGAKGINMQQVFFDITYRTDLPFQPTYHIHDLRELSAIL